MGRSFVEFKGHGFWTRDEWLLDWLMAALRDINDIKNLKRWELEIGQEWDKAIATGFPGGIYPNLDALLTNDEKCQFVINLSKKIGETAMEPRVKRLAELFVDLIEGKLKTTNSSPIDYW